MLTKKIVEEDDLFENRKEIVGLTGLVNLQNITCLKDENHVMLNHSHVPTDGKNKNLLHVEPNQELSNIPFDKKDVEKISSKRNMKEGNPEDVYMNNSMYLEMSKKDGSGKGREVCPKCHKTFSTKQSLSTHMKTAKSCIDQRHQKKIFQCSYCKKTLSSKQMLLYHYGICQLKTQHRYEQKLNHLQSLITNGGCQSPPTVEMNSQEPQSSTSENSHQFYETNVLMRCELLSMYAMVPKKCAGLVFELFPGLSTPIEIKPSSHIVLILGIKMHILVGWVAHISITHDYSEKGLYFSSLMIDSTYDRDVRLSIHNMRNNTSIMIDPSISIADIRFFKTPDHFNIHLNCIRQRVGNEGVETTS